MSTLVQTFGIAVRQLREARGYAVVGIFIMMMAQT